MAVPASHFQGTESARPHYGRVEMRLSNVILPKAPPTENMSQTWMTKPSNTHSNAQIGAFFFCPFISFQGDAITLQLF